MLTTIIFDFDGVIIDSFDLCYKSFCINFKDIDEQWYKDLFIDNIFKSFENIKDKQRSETLDRKKAIEYAHQERLKLAPYKNMKEIINTLSENYELYINTSSHSASIEERIKKYELKDKFTKVLWADVAKSKVEKFEYLQNKNIDTNQMVFITDTAGDIYEADQLKIPSIAVTRWFHDVETLIEAQPRFMATKPDEILTYIENFSTKLY